MTDPATEDEADRAYTKGESPKERAITRVIRELNAIKWSEAETERVASLMRELKAFQESLASA